MSDLLLELGANPKIRGFLESLPLPIPLPETLRREKGPRGARPLEGRTVLVGAPAGATLLEPLAKTLAQAGADSVVDAPGDGDARLAPFRAAGEAWGRKALPASELAKDRRVDALVIEASGIDTPEGLRALYDLGHAHVSRLARSGRVIVLGRKAPRDAGPAEVAAQAALVGFTKSVAKEIGRKGATANLVRVGKGGEGRLGPVLRFLLSARAAFVSGQPLTVDGQVSQAGEPPLERWLDGKTALVTGAARGIGRATAQALAEEGARVLCLDRPEDEEPLTRAAREVGGLPVLIDMGRDDAAARLVERVSSLGGIDVLVHNAGITRDRTLAKMSEREWDQVLGINLAAVVRTTEALLPLVRDGGRIVALSSIAGIAGNMGQTAYAASKAGLIGWAKALAPRVAGRGVAVNCVAPGFIETRLTAAIPVGIREVARRLSALSQGGLPEDVAEAIAFLSSPGAAGLTGRTLRVCGGAFVGA